MLAVKVDYSELNDLLKHIGPVHKDILYKSIRNESYRLHRVMRSYARFMAGSGWKPFAPITKAFRKGRGIGSFLGPARGAGIRYHVDPDTLRGEIGVLSRRDVRKYKDARFEGVSAQFAQAATRLASGYKFRQTRKRQRQQYAALKARGKIGYLAGRGHLIFRTKTLEKRYGVIVPRVGWHRVKARPFVEPVAMKEQQRSVHNISRLYKDRVAKLNTRGWINRWGGGAQYVP